MHCALKSAVISRIFVHSALKNPIIALKSAVFSRNPIISLKRSLMLCTVHLKCCIFQDFCASHLKIL